MLRIALDGFKKKEVRLCNESRYLNTLVIGQKGTGKSDHVLLNMFYQDLKDKNHSIIVFTSKGDTSYKLYTLAKHLERKVHIIKPETHTFNINLLKGEEKDVIEYMTQLLGFSFENKNMTERYYQEKNQTLLINSLKVIKRIFGEGARLKDLYDLMTNVGGMGRKYVLHFSKLETKNNYMKKEHEMITSWFLNEYFTASNDKKAYDSTGIVRTNIKNLMDYQHICEFNSEEVDIPDFKKIFKNKEVLIIDTEYLKHQNYSHFMGTYLLLKIKNELFKKESAESFIYLDDFQKFYPIFGDLIEGSHIKNIGVTLFLQETGQLNVSPGYRELVLNNVSNLILLDRISYEDYLFFETYMNAELLNRNRGDMVYKIVNEEGSDESAKATLYSNEKLILHYEKYLDYKKQLTKKRRRRIRKGTSDEKVIKEKKVELELKKIASRDINIHDKVTIEQVKREDSEKEYLIPDEVFSEDEH